MRVLVSKTSGTPTAGHAVSHSLLVTAQDVAALHTGSPFLVKLYDFVHQANLFIAVISVDVPSAL